jgi:hypothetical protein
MVQDDPAEQDRDPEHGGIQSDRPAQRYTPNAGLVLSDPAHRFTPFHRRAVDMTVRRTALVGALAMAILGVPALPVLAQDLGAAPVDTLLVAATAMAAQKFRMAEAPVTGSFQIRKEGGRQVLVLSSDFKTNDQAPDLKVILSPSANPLAATKPPQYALKPGTYTILAPLKSSSGAQSYLIPDSIDLKGMRSVLIWCQKFNATMAWAPLNP